MFSGWGAQSVCTVWQRRQCMHMDFSVVLPKHELGQTNGIVWNLFLLLFSAVNELSLTRSFYAQFSYIVPVLLLLLLLLFFLFPVAHVLFIIARTLTQLLAHKTFMSTITHTQTNKCFFFRVFDIFIYCGMCTHEAYLFKKKKFEWIKYEIWLTTRKTSRDIFLQWFRLSQFSYHK